MKFSRKSVLIYWGIGIYYFQFFVTHIVPILSSLKNSNQRDYQNGNDMNEGYKYNCTNSWPLCKFQDATRLNLHWIC